MPALFVDTGAFYAAADASDEHHEAAAASFAARGRAGDLLTSDYVFVETWMLLRARLGRDAAIRWWDAMRTGVVRTFGVTSLDLARAREIARDWADQDFSLVDCASFALMERLGIAEAFAFDSHFRVFRFGPARRCVFRRCRTPIPGEAEQPFRAITITRSEATLGSVNCLDSFPWSRALRACASSRR